MAQLVKSLTLDFGSGHDLRVVKLNPVSGSVLSLETAYPSSSSSLLSPSLLNKLKKKIFSQNKKNRTLPASHPIVHLHPILSGRSKGRGCDFKALKPDAGTLCELGKSWVEALAGWAGSRVLTSGSACWWDKVHRLQVSQEHWST